MANTDQQQAGETPAKRTPKRMMKWGSGALVAFLAFAPPGTMIVIFLLAWHALGGSWILVGGFAILAMGVVLFFLLRRRKTISDRS